MDLDSLEMLCVSVVACAISRTVSHSNRSKGFTAKYTGGVKVTYAGNKGEKRLVVHAVAVGLLPRPVVLAGQRRGRDGTEEAQPGGKEEEEERGG